MRSDHELNRASWDELAALHGQDAYYDSAALVAGASSLIEEEEAALLETIGQDLTARRILHLQCHLGVDAITFARRGAVVTGVDFSPVALSKALNLANRCGVHVDWICADATELPTSLDRNIDLVWATIGVLCWISDIHAWMRALAGTLADHGRLVLIDGHPTSRGIGLPLLLDLLAVHGALALDDLRLDIISGHGEGTGGRNVHGDVPDQILERVVPGHEVRLATQLDQDADPTAHVHV
jgi:SAM-dependent methyltransferase